MTSISYRDKTTLSAFTRAPIFLSNHLGICLLAALSLVCFQQALADDVRVAWDNGGAGNSFTNPDNWGAFWDPTPPGGNNNQLPGYESGSPSNAIIQGAYTGTNAPNLTSDFTPAFAFSPLIVRAGASMTIAANLNIGSASFLAGQTNTNNYVTQTTGTVTCGALSIGNSSENANTSGYTLTGGTINATSVTINKSGKLTIGATGSVNCPITIQPSVTSGVLTSAGDGAAVTGAIILNHNGTDFRGGGNSITFSGGINSAADENLSLNLQAIINSNPIDLNAGELTQTSNGSSNPTQLNVGGNDWGLARINFGGCLQLGLANAMPTDAGVEFGWHVDASSSGTLDLNGYDQTVTFLRQTTLHPTNNGNQNVTGGGTLTINTAPGSYDFHGRFTDGTTATALTKSGTGTQILDNNTGTASSNTGVTTVNGGVLQIGDNDTAADSNSVPGGSIVVNSGGTFQLATDSYNQLGTRAYTINSGGIMTTVSANQNAHNFYGAVAMNGGTLTSANGTFSGGNWIFNDTVTIGGSSVSTISANTISNRGSSFTVADSVAGAGTDLLVSSSIVNAGGGTEELIKNGPGTMELTANNTYTGPTTVNGGVLELNNGTINAASVITVDNATLQISGTSNNRINNNTVTIENGATITDDTTGSNVHSIGATTFSNGGVLTSTGTARNGTFGNFFKSGTFTVTGNAMATISAVEVSMSNGTFDVGDVTTGTDLLISSELNEYGNAVLTKTGAGTLELTGTNTHDSGTAVNAGTLVVTGSTGTGAMTVASGATLAGAGTIGGVVTVSGFLSPGSP